MKTRSVARTFRVVFICIAAVVVVFFAIAALLSRRAKADLDAELAIAKTDGVQTTFDDFEPNPRIPEDQNAWTYFLQLNELVTYDSEILDKPQSAQVRAEFYQNSGAWYRLVYAASLRHCSVVYRTEKEYDHNLSDERGLWHLVALACADAKTISDDGQPVAALDMMAKIAPVAGQLSGIPGILPLLTRMLVAGTFIRFVSEILHAHGAEKGVAPAAATFLARLGTLPDMRAEIADTNLWSQLELSESSSEQLSRAMQNLKYDPHNSEPFRRLSRQLFISGTRERWRAERWRLTLQDIAIWKEFDGNYRRTADRFNVAPHPLPEEVGLMTWPKYNYSAEIANRIGSELADRRILTQAAAALEEKQRTGLVPDRLPLSGDDARDPTGEGPFSYVRTKNGFKISMAAPLRSAASIPGVGDFENFSKLTSHHSPLTTHGNLSKRQLNKLPTH